MATAYARAERGIVDGTPGSGRRLRLSDVPLGEVVELESMELGASDLEALLERGVLPGCRVSTVRRSPFGDPIVEVEGTRLALRREMASCLRVRPVTSWS